MPNAPDDARDRAVAPPPTVENIQALRGVAALLIVWLHARGLVQGLSAQDAPGFLQTALGAIGVDLFFVISGYVICLAAEQKQHGPRDFAAARVARVVPLYLVFTLFWIAFDLLLGARVPFGCLWNGIFYLPVFDMGAYTLPPLDVGWTLSFEMWFYTVFSLLLIFWKPKQVAFILPILFTIGAALMMLYQGAWFFPRFMFHPFVLEFALGCVVFQTQRWVFGFTPWLLLVASVMFYAAFSLRSDYLAVPLPLFHDRLDLAWLRVLLWGGPAALLVAGFVGVERHARFVLPRWLIYIGGFSFSLYLSHRLAAKLLDKFGPHFHLVNPYEVFAIMLVASLLLGWLSWVLLEKPLTRWAQRLLQVHSSRALREATARDPAIETAPPARPTA